MVDIWRARASRGEVRRAGVPSVTAPRHRACLIGTHPFADVQTLIRLDGRRQVMSKMRDCRKERLMSCVTIKTTRDDATAAQRVKLIVGATDPAASIVAGAEVALKRRGIGGVPAKDCGAKVLARGGANG